MDRHVQTLMVLDCTLLPSEECLVGTLCVSVHNITFVLDAQPYHSFTELPKLTFFSLSPLTNKQGPVLIP